jgi:L-2-hydroxyglutarate oxidase LhgO
MQKVDITIIGAGVVGLAIAYGVSSNDRNVIVIESHPSFGMETSSRNSEVIHASIYYPQNSLKGKLCLEGNEMMYALCKRNKIPHKNSGKLIVATSSEEEKKLPFLLETAINNGAKGVRIVNKKEIGELEPNVEAIAAIYAPTSGIVDSHALMQYFEADAIASGCMFSYNSRLIGLKKENNGWLVEVSDKDNNNYSFFSKIVINSAGLESGNVAAMAGIDIDKAGYRINYHKGIYFRVTKKLDLFPKMLIYPIPPYPGSVGIHTTPDLGGGMRLGPHFFWSDKIDFTVDERFKELFFEESGKYLTFLEIEDLQPDMAGIMSAVQSPGGGMKDFIIRHEKDMGFENLINLVGIESPGLTASPAIGKYVGEIVDGII